MSIARTTIVRDFFGFTHPGEFADGGVATPQVAVDNYGLHSLATIKMIVANQSRHNLIAQTIDECRKFFVFAV
jgi:hypothetical protein